MAVLPIGIGSSEAGGYQIERSLRFNSADSAYLSRTPASAGNQKTYTVSAWFKRSALGATAFSFLSVGTSTGSPRTDWSFNQDYLAVGFNLSGSSWVEVDTSALYRDVSAWYHVVVAVDTTQATSTDRVKIYVNGSLVTAFLSASYPSQNADTLVNSTGVHAIGRYNAASNSYYSGYMAEFYMIDGSALDPSSFGETDSDTGVWKPKAYTGSYGTNGFYLKFADNSGTTSTTLGKDSSGNGNNWTPNNFSVTAGAGNDSLVDTPTPYGTDTGAGGEVRGNYATLNALAKGTNVTLANGNLDYTAPNSASAFGSALSTIGMSSGKWYAEYVWTSGATNSHVGIATGNINLNTYLANNATGYSYYADGRKFNNGSGTAYGASYANGDVIGVAFDADAGTLTFYKNNVSQGTAFTGLTNGPYFFGVGMGDAGQTATFNFGQRPFAYTAPSGFKALCTQNLPEPTVVQGDDYFNTVLWTGDGTSSRAITGVGFQPDWVWDKMRSGAYQHAIVDSVRGGNKVLHSNSTSAEDVDWQYGYVSSFDSDGFTIQAGSTSAENWNLNGSTFVAWCWNAGGSTVTNTAGTISAQVRANPTAGISIATWSYGGATGTYTVGHGLSQAPSLIITRGRNIVSNWGLYHSALGATSGINLNQTAAASSDSGWWGNTAPTSSVMTLGTFFDDNANYVAYCFAEIPGFSAFGSYTGNGSTDGPFVYTGFRPAWVMIKQSSAAGNNWAIVDDKRDDYNVADLRLFANASDAESSSYVFADLLSNGFKIRGSLGSTNTSSATYIYAAFAENPFKYSLAR